MITSHTKQYAVGSLLFLAVSVSIAGLTYYQIYREGTKLTTHMEVIGKSKLMQEQYNELFAVLKKNDAEHTQLSEFLLTEDQTIHFLSEIETLARNANLAFSTDSLEVKPLPTPPFESVDLRLRAEGSRADVITFLNILETLPYFSRINALTLTAKKGAQGDIWVANITLMVALHAYDK